MPMDRNTDSERKPLATIVDDLTTPGSSDALWRFNDDFMRDWLAVSDDQCCFINFRYNQCFIVDLAQGRTQNRVTLNSTCILQAIKTGDDEFICFDIQEKAMFATRPRRNFLRRFKVNRETLTLEEIIPAAPFAGEIPPCPYDNNPRFAEDYLQQKGRPFYDYCESQSGIHLFHYDAETILFVGELLPNRGEQKNVLNLLYIDIATLRIKGGFSLTPDNIFLDAAFDGSDQLYLLEAKQQLRRYQITDKTLNALESFSLPFKAERVWLSPVAGNFIFSCQKKRINQMKLVNCKVINNEMIVQFEIPTNHWSRSTFRILSCGHLVYYDRVARQLKSVSLVTGKEAAYLSSESSLEFFETKAEGIYRVCALDSDSKNRKLFPLANYDFKQEEAYQIVKSALPLPTPIVDMTFEYAHDVRFFSRIQSSLSFDENFEENMLKKLEAKIVAADAALKTTPADRPDYPQTLLVKTMLEKFLLIIKENPLLSYRQCRELLEKQFPFSDPELSGKDARDDVKRAVEFIESVASTIRPSLSVEGGLIHKERKIS